MDDATVEKDPLNNIKTSDKSQFSVYSNRTNEEKNAVYMWSHNILMINLQLMSTISHLSHSLQSIKFKRLDISYRYFSF